VGTADAITQQIDLVNQQVQASVEAARISELQYREGTIDITTLINQQQSLFSAQIALVNAKQSRLQNSINLYIALGGGWDQKTSDSGYKPSLDWFPL
jgi:multidrug efflux system outer membrane protein